MLTIFETIPQEHMSKLESELMEKIFNCPACGNTNTFYSYPARICPVCGEPFPAIENLIDDLFQRKMYHFGHFFQS